MQNPTTSQLETSALQQHILGTLLYYDIFNYPLTPNEVFQFLGTNSISRDDVEQALHDLSRRGQLFKYEDFYSVQSLPSLATRRKKGNAFAQKLMPKAKRQARLISKFPFVRGVLASGSLSKGYMEESSDIDFFIITVPGRLWIARTLLVLYKRLFLANSHKYFCVNYFVSEDHLEIDDRNIFTATELATVLPLYGRSQYHHLIARNNWILRWFPNFSQRDCVQVDEGRASGLKLLWESVFNRMFVRQTENFCMRITKNRWKRLYRNQYDASDYDVAFRSTKYSSKNHPSHFQRKVVGLYQERIMAHNLKLLQPDAPTASRDVHRS